MKNAQATIRDLALRLNTSISTVSRALRGHQDIRPETKKAVLEMAKKLHYEPNRVAQSLRINKTNTLGVIVPEIVMHFFSSSLSGIQEYAAKLFIDQVENPESFKPVTKVLHTEFIIRNSTRKLPQHLDLLKSVVQNGPQSLARG